MWNYEVGDRVAMTDGRVGIVIEVEDEYWCCGDGCCSDYHINGYRLELEDGTLIDVAPIDLVHDGWDGVN